MSLYAHNESLLLDYYDPMYEYQLDQKQDQVVLRGDAATLAEQLADNQVLLTLAAGKMAQG